MAKENEEKATNLEENAGQLFLLMGREYRISRSIRAQWFFQQFNSILPQPKQQDELLASTEELEILSVLSDDSLDPVISNKEKTLRLVPSTHITFIGRRYRFVFCLDVSPSLAIVDIQSGNVITDEVFQKLKNCLSALVAPFSVPGNNVILCPELYITVIAYTSILSPETPQILIQGCLVTEENIDIILDCINSKLCKLEDTLAATVASTGQTDTKPQSQKAENDTDSIQSDPVTLLSPEAGPITMLRSAILALQLLPDNASAGAVVITDGVFALPDASAIDSLLAQLRGSTVCCSFLKVGSGFHAHCSIGYVPHCDLMQFIAMATSGAYLAKAPPVVREAREDGGEDLPLMNLYHKALLCWSFQKDYDLSKIDSWIGDAINLNEDDLAWPFVGARSTLSYALSEWERNAMQPSMHKKQMESKLHTSITSVISVRLREGYSVQDVSFTKGGKQLEVKLTLPWKQHVQIEYTAVAAWPLSRSNRVTHVEVTITAPYEFLHDVSYLSKEPFTSGYRAMVVKKFRQTMKNIQSTDELLVHLQSFSSNPVYYTIPESAKNGVPLFYLPPNSSNPVLSLQHEKKISKSQESQFAVFWKPVLTLDTAIWQRWMHCHRIGLLLEHDIPLPKNLHLPIGNERFHSIQCRMALSSLNSLLRQMGSFVLLENHSYIKFIEGENPDSPPSSFCLLRVSSRAPCIVIRLAFLGGTPGYIRHAITKEIRSKLVEVTAPIGPISKTSKIQVSQNRNIKQRSQRLAEEKPCVLVLKKPLERILVRYERVPEDLFFPYPDALLYSVYSTISGLQYANRTNENHMKVLCHYLYHQRWVWSVQEDGPRQSNAEFVARVLGTLTKLRLQEKFNIACSNAGIITMAKEIKMKDHTSKSGQKYPCIVQYVMFPPYSKLTGSAVEEWVDEGKAMSPDNNQKLQMVTEVWIEPQFGVIANDETALQYLDGLRYFEVPQAIFNVDYKYVSAFLTFERIWRMCDDQVICAPPSICPTTSHMLPPSPDRNWTVETVPYPFDVTLLLPKNRQVEMVFSSMKENENQDTSSPVEMPNEVLYKLLIEDINRLHDREIKLSEKNCRELMKHILQRERHKHPVPFFEFLKSSKSESQGSNGESGEDFDLNQTPLIKWRCFARSVSGLGHCRLMLTFIPASLKYVKMFGKQQRSSFDSEDSGNVIECVRESLSRRSLTPIMEDVEKQSLSPTPVAEYENNPFFNDKPRPPSLSPQTEQESADLGNESIAENINDTRFDPDLRNMVDLSIDVQPEKYVKFKDEDNAVTPTEENLSPVAHCTPCNDDGWFCYSIPIYCYDCPLSTLTNVEHKHESGEGSEEPRKRDDIFQDFTQTSQVFVDPFSLEELPRMVEGRTFGRFGSSKDLLLHCNAVHDIFFRSFVTSIFTSLQSDHQMNVRDVQSAVDTCEENFLEIDITEFIRSLCGHFIKNNAPFKTSDSVESSLLLRQKTQFPIFQGSDFQGFGSLQFLKSVLNDNCESAQGLHQSIKKRFMSILGKYFKPIPTSGDLYFYFPQSVNTTKKSCNSSSFEPEEDKDGIGFHDNQDGLDDEDNKSDAGSEVFGETVVLIQDDDQQYPLTDDSDSDFGDSSDESDLGEVEDDDRSLKTPLFLQLTCSLRDRSTIGGGSMTPVSVSSLPVCIGEIISRMEDADTSFDLFSPSLKITIDLNCLTLSPEPDHSTLRSTVSQEYPLPSNSYSSVGSPLSISPQEKFEFKRQDSKTVTSYDIDGLNGPDPLKSLPNQQRAAINTTCESIQWLLQDEVVSELRLTGPYTTATLDKVERHVQKSEGHSLCIYRNVPLQFVFGAEQSMELFTKEIEEINVLDYRLSKIEDYYYLTLPNEDGVMLQETQNSQQKGEEESVLEPMPNKDDVGDNAFSKTVSSSLIKSDTDADERSSRRDSNTDCAFCVKTENNREIEVASVSQQASSHVTPDSLEEHDFVDGKSEDSFGRKSEESGLEKDENRVVESELQKEETLPEVQSDTTRNTGGTITDGHLPGNTKEEPLPDEHSKQESQGSANVSTSLDLSISLTVKTSPEKDNPCCEDLATPGSDFMTPVDATSTPNKITQPQESLYSEKDDIRLVSSSDKSDFLDEIPTLATIEDKSSLPEKESTEEEKKIGKRSPGSSTKTSPRNHNVRKIETANKLNFWLVLRLCDNCVDIYFHTRHSEDTQMTATKAEGLIETATNAIHEKCRTVNQQMLLQDLYDTKMCNSLLFPEADEDIWKHEALRMSVSPVGVYISKSDGGSYPGRYVQGEFIFQPGHFQCLSQWYSHLTFHPRLQDPSGRTSNSLGCKIIRSVLDRFGVKNRRDMFVYKESSGRVFYLRLLESLCVTEQSQFPCDERVQDSDDEDKQSRDEAISNTSLIGSRTSSRMSLTRVGQEQDEDISEPRSNYKRTGLGLLSGDKVEQSIALHVYGVDEPGTEITVDLVEVLVNRLDEATLDNLTFLLSRNPNSKLNYSDVRFIQPPNKSPTAKLAIVIPPLDIGYLYPLFYYLKQNLLQVLHIPRYSSDLRPWQQFRDPEDIDDGLSSEIFLYNRPHSSGGKGLACISIKVVDRNKKQIHFTVARTPSINVDNLDRDFYEELTKVEMLSDDTFLEDNLIVQFSVWERGNIGLDQLSKQLKSITQYALCDLLMEYLLLPAPLSFIPKEYQLNISYRLRSLSEPPTPSNISPSSRVPRPDTPKLELEKSTTLKENEIQGIRSETPPPPTRKISSSSAPGHRRTPSSESQGKEFKTFLEKQSFKGHRRSKSTEIHGKIYEVRHRTHTYDGHDKGSLACGTTEAPLTCSTSRDSLVAPSEKSNIKPKRKLGFSDNVKPSNEDILKGNKTPPMDMVGKADTTERESTAASLKMANEVQGGGDGHIHGGKNEQGKRAKEDGDLSVRPNIESYLSHEPSRDMSSRDPTSRDVIHDATGTAVPKEDSSVELVSTFETLSHQEILESQEYTSLPSTPAFEESYIPTLKIKDEDFSEGSRPLSSEVKHDEGEYSSFSPFVKSANLSPVLIQKGEQETWQDLEHRRRTLKYKLKKRMQFEDGERGELHPNFHLPGRELFSFAHSLGTPSIHVIEGQILNRFAIDFLLNELSNLVVNTCPEMKPRLYRQAPHNLVNSCSHNAEEMCSCPKYKALREPLKADVEESSVDMTGRVFVRTPGSPCFFVLIARDHRQWRTSLGLENELNGEESNNLSSHSRGLANIQRFKAMEPTSPASMRNQESGSLCSYTSCTIPRQKLILLTFIDKRLILFTYNLATDFNKSLEDQVQRLLHWNNARCHLAACLITQKMGLFQHLPFAKINEDKKGKDVNPYCMSANDMDMAALISRTTPALSDRDRSTSRSLANANLLVFDQVLRDVVPTTPLQQTSYFQHRDPVKQHGYQFREIRSAQIKANIIQTALDQLYVNWQQTPPHPPVADDKLEILKRSSRLIHYCACPLLFHPEWRKKLSDKSNQDPFEKERKTSRENTKDTITEEPEDKWHKDLRSAFIQQYIQYMQSLQFVVVQTRPQSPKNTKGSKRFSRRTGSYKTKHNGSSENKKQPLSRSNSDNPRVFHQFLQKTSLGGIMLMELLFQGLYFYVRLYSIDCSRIPSGKNVSPHIISIFLEDCSHYKDYIHLLSFTYDFHLRQAQSYLSGRQMIFNKGYRVMDLLAEILRRNPEYPGFARNHICSGEIAVPCEPIINSKNVFKYIVKHSTQYDFRTIKVNTKMPSEVDTILLGSDLILKPTRHTDNNIYTHLRDNQEYDITLAVTLKNSFEGSVINMEYYILVTSRRELFPKLSLKGRGPISHTGVAQTPTEKTGNVQTKGSRVRFANTDSKTANQRLKLSPERKGKPFLTAAEIQSFHRSASSPHSLNKMVQGVAFSSVTQSHSDENIADVKKSLSVSPHSYSSGALSSMDGRSTREIALLNESSQKAHDHLIHVICRAQTHSKRDLLWYRLLAGGTGEDDRETKKTRRKSEFRRSIPDLAELWSSGTDVEEIVENQTLGTATRHLSMDEFKHLLSIVVCKSLKNCDFELVPLLSMNVLWYLNLFRVLRAKFSRFHRMFSGDDSGLHYLVLLNPNELDMFVLVFVDENTNKTDIQIVFRSEGKVDGDGNAELRHLQKPIRDHIYSVLNAVCFHMWGGLLPA